MPSLTHDDVLYISMIPTSIFVETGTNTGQTVTNMKSFYKKIYSIELEPNLADACKDKFKNDSNIEIIEGDSSIVLKTLCPILDEPTFFWLDGHWCGDNTAKGPLDCPLLEELQSINTLCTSECIIAIDDARLFGLKLAEDWTNITVDNVIQIVSNRLQSVTYYPSSIDPKDRLILHLFKL